MGATNSIVTAESARKLSSEASKLINHILKAIKEAAEYGNTKTTFTAENLSKDTISNISNKLTELGFDVKHYERKIDQCVGEIGGTEIFTDIIEVSFIVKW